MSDKSKWLPRSSPQQGRREFLKAASAMSTALWVSGEARGARGQRRIRVGQIGVAHGHATKLSVYRQSDDYEVVGIVEPDEALRAEAMKQPAFKDLSWLTQDELLNGEGLDAVLVETRVRESLDAAEACIDAGIHVHLDKPAGTSFSQFRRILSKAESKQLVLQMGYMYRYNPAFVLLRQMLQQKWLGEIFEVHTVMSKVVEPEDRLELAEYPGGIMFELGCHLIDLVVGYFGSPDAVTSYRRHSSPIADSLADNMLAVLEYNSLIATVKSSAQEVQGGDRRHFVVCGTEGTVHIQPLDSPSATITLSSARGSFHSGQQTITFPKYTRYVDDAADMARIIRGEKVSDFSYAHDLAVQRTVLQACGLSLE